MKNEELIEAWQQGNEKAFSELFLNNNQQLVRTLVYRTGCSYFDAEDVLQNSWLKFIRYKEKYNGKNFFNFMVSVSFRVYLDRKRIKSVLRTIELKESHKTEPIKDYTEPDLTRLYQSIMKIEPVSHRDTLILRVIKNMSHQEITKVLKLCSINTSIGNYRYALKKLTKIMKENDTPQIKETNLPATHSTGSE